MKEKRGLSPNAPTPECPANACLVCPRMPANAPEKQLLPMALAFLEFMRAEAPKLIVEQPLGWCPVPAVPPRKRQKATD